MNALRLVTELNSDSPPAHVKASIIRLIEAINGPAIRSRSSRRLRQAQAAINAQLEGTRIVPYLRPARNGQWVAGWHPDINSQGGAFGPWVRHWTVVVWNLAASGSLSSVRRCEKCRKWYAARRQDQRFCSLACRQEDYISSSHGRAKRTAYMRKYRRR